MRRLGYLAIGIVIGVISAAAALNAQQRHVSRDALKVSPQFYKVRLENERVRVLDYALKPGEKEAMHTHEPSVAYILNDATLRTSFPDGTAAVGLMHAGDVHWRDRKVEHTVENVGDTVAHALIVEIKGK